ncbi:MAG: ATP-binding cassette domain-containing protein [Ruminococcaceae bacterium]|nr:ATP-binding cassette domain-containing protein [Oscillospiraceae bacterium]
MELVFDCLSKHYGAVQALQEVSFVLTPGVHGLLGPNGAGKSTMMNILSGNLKASSGCITYDGRDIQKMGDSFRRVLGYMPQQQALYPGFTAAQFLGYMACLRGLSKAQAAKAVPKVLEAVALSEMAGRRIKTFSGGMKQRLLIAQAILADPEVLVLDEPTAGLDPKQRIAIRNLIASIAERKIVIISTHVVADVACIAKEILLLKQGHLLSQLSPGELIGRMDGLVWEVVVKKEDLPKWQAQYRISNIAYDDDGFCLRLLSETEISGGRRVKPNLEDVYLHYFEE